MKRRLAFQALEYPLEVKVEGIPSHHHPSRRKEQLVYCPQILDISQYQRENSPSQKKKVSLTLLEYMFSLNY